MYRAKVPETCAEEVLTQVLSLVEVHFCQKTVPWIVRVIGQSGHTFNYMYIFTYCQLYK